MRVFFCELRKLWNWKTTAAILAFFMLFFTLFLWSKITEIQRHLSGEEVSSMIDYALSKELLDRYGTVIERDELITDFGLDDKIQEIYDRADAIVLSDESGVFAKYGIHSYMEYEKYPAYEMEDEDFEMIALNRDAYFHDIGLQLSLLRDMKQRYNTNNPHLNSHIDGTAFVYARNLEARDDRSVMTYYLPFELSRYVMLVTILCVICTVFLVSPFITTDRTRKIYPLQYVSAYGRKILGTQFAAVTISVFVMSFVITFVCGAAYASLNTQIFADASIVSFWGMSFFMYSITYGKYAILLAAMPTILSTTVACVGFLMSRFSDTYVRLLYKVVPLALTGIIVGTSAVRAALTNENTIFVLFGSSLPVPEIWVCGSIALAGAIAAVCVIRREKRVDV